MLTYDELMEEKESEIASLRAQLSAARTPVEGPIDSRATVAETAQHDSLNELSIPTSRQPDTSMVQSSRKGKAPPVDLFTGESSDVLWEDWLPTLERTATWNNWTENEKLLQLAGHLRGKAAQEWALLSTADKSTFASATRALGSRLDRGGKALDAKKICHTVQQSSEAVADFIFTTGAEIQTCVWQRKYVSRDKRYIAIWTITRRAEIYIGKIPCCIRGKEIQ